MRKIFIILTLIVSSFFIFNNDVKADTIDLTISGTSNSYLNSTYFQDFRNHVLDNLETDNMYYVIVYNSTNDTYYSYHFESYDGNFIMDNNTLKLSPYLKRKLMRHANIGRYYESYGSGSHSLSATIDDSNVINYVLLDTNYPDFKYLGTNEYNIIYDECTYILKNGSKVRTLYEYSIANQNSCILEDEVEEDVHAEKKEILSNFYNMVITKIGELANIVFNDYILLFVIGIFIFIFVFEIIFRRLL